jgi:hypothetical protein
VVLPTKFHYLAFNSKNGDSLINNISFPFTFFEKHKVFCVPIVASAAHVTALIETEDRIPIVFTHNNALSTHLLCPETLKVFTNWIANSQEVKPSRMITLNVKYLPDTASDNYISVKTSKTTSNFSTPQQMTTKTFWILFKITI